MSSQTIQKISFNVFLLGLVSLLADVSSEMIMPVLPLFILSIGGSGIIIGLIGGLEEGIASTFKVIAGYFSDRLGKRKIFLVFGYLIPALSRLFLPLSATWQQVLALRSADRTGKGIRTAPRDAIIAESSTAENRGKAFGLHRAMDTSGAIAGSVIAFLCIWFFAMDYSRIFLLAAAVAFLALLPVAFVKEAKTEPRKRTLIASISELPKPFRFYLLITATFAAGNFTYMFFILRALDLFGMSIAVPVLLYVWFNIIYSMFSLPSGILSDRMGRKNILLAGYSLFGITCILFAVPQSPILLIILFGLYGLSYAVIEGNQRAFASDFVEQDLRGTALGTFHTIIGFSTFLSGLIAGVLWDSGHWLSFTYGALMAFSAVVLLLFLKPERTEAA
jgi:MFS family permease